nr:AraC family transcriptional regulator [uncultured Desulfobacter sp.]
MYLIHFVRRLIHFAGEVFLNSTTSLPLSKLTGGLPCWPETEQPSSVPINPIYGTGFLSGVVFLQNDIILDFSNYSLYGDGDFIFKGPLSISFPYAVFISCLSGVQHFSYTKPRTPLGPKYSNIELPEFKPGLSMTVNRLEQIQIIGVCMPPAVMSKLTGKSSAELMEMMDRLDYISEKKHKGPDRSKELDFAQITCSRQMLNSYLNNPNDRLYLEAKALELMALQLRQLEHLSEEKHKKKPIGYKEDKILYASEILKNKMESPPKLLELARKVGLNHNQLIQGFKDIYGECPFGYLRILRLENARKLLTNRECNVSEAAYLVGFSSPSHFSKAFKKHYGISPCTCLK